MLKNAVKIGKYLVGRLNSLKGRNPVIKNVKGLALMIGVELDVEDGSAVYRKCLEKGLLINCTQKNILRIMPPLNVKKAR
jgi:acetylornithine/succinyldiaminopimelate/putrescine aminotransferase